MKSRANDDLTEEISPLLLSSLIKDPSDLTEKELEYLYKLNQLEIDARNMVASTRQSLLRLKKGALSAIDQRIDHLHLTDEEKELFKNIYKQTIIPSIEQAAEKLSKSDTLYTALLSETTVGILEGILNFKKSFDENFPGAMIAMEVLAPVIVTVISIYCPPAGLVLAASAGLFELAAKFLSTENLENTIDRMRNDLAEIKKDKELKVAYQTGEKLAELSQKTGISTVSLGKLELPLEDAIYTTKEVGSNVAAKQMLQAVCAYAETNLPLDAKQINKTFEKFQASTKEKLEKLGVSAEALEISGEIMNSAITKAKIEMMRTLDADNRVFEKIASVQQSADILDKAAEHIAIIVGKDGAGSKGLKKTASDSIKQEITNKIRGNVEDIARHLTSESGAKDFAKKALGSNLANEITIKRAAPSAAIAQGIERGI
jgi:hypothetical protein